MDWISRTWTDWWISSTTMLPELSISNILNAQPISSWNLTKDKKLVKRKRPKRDITWSLNSYYFPRPNFLLVQTFVEATSMSQIFCIYFVAPTRSRANISSRNPIIPELSLSRVLKTMSDRYWPVLMAGKNVLNCSLVTPSGNCLRNHFNIAMLSSSFTSGLN